MLDYPWQRFIGRHEKEGQQGGFYLCHYLSVSHSLSDSPYERVRSVQGGFCLLSFVLPVVIVTIGICRCLFLAILGAISCSKQTKLGYFHHSWSHVEWNKKGFSWGEFKL